MNKIYLLVFDPYKTNAGAMHSVIAQSQYINNWWHYISSGYILKSAYTLETIQNEIVRLLPNQNFLLVEINAYNFGGWLPGEAWDWIRQQR